MLNVAGAQAQLSRQASGAPRDSARRGEPASKPPKPPKPKRQTTPRCRPVGGGAAPEHNTTRGTEYLSTLSTRRVQCPQIRHQHVHWLAFPACSCLCACARGCTCRGTRSRVSRASTQTAGALHGQPGHLVVEVPPSCDSVYEIDGVPFSVAMRDGVFRVPGHMIIKDVIDDCGVQAYLDSTSTHISMPPRGSRRAQKFTIHVDDQLVVDSGWRRCPLGQAWCLDRAFDFPRTHLHSSHGGRHDIIYTYEAR